MISKSKILALALSLAAVAAGIGCTRPAEPPPPMDSTPSVNRNGVYAVLRDAPTWTKAQDRDTACAVLPYDHKYTDSTPGEPLRYIALDPTSFVPLILEGNPDATKDTGGKTILSVTLKKEYADALENFTRAHLGGKVAIVLDGEIVTIHKVRSIISGGKLQITRCSDNACDVLRAKLTE